jgi:UDP-N-acetylglucosamine enolpyruvyl transferase
MNQGLEFRETSRELVMTFQTQNRKTISTQASPYPGFLQSLTGILVWEQS